jgi:hypothetical protein
MAHRSATDEMLDELRRHGRGSARLEHDHAKLIEEEPLPIGRQHLAVRMVSRRASQVPGAHLRPARHRASPLRSEAVRAAEAGR